MPAAMWVELSLELFAGATTFVVTGGLELLLAIVVFALAAAGWTGR